MPARMRPSLLALTGVALLLTASGCGDQDDPVVVAPGGPGESTQSSSPTSPPSPSPSTVSPTRTTGEPVPADVTITVDDGSGTVTTHTLTCEPAGGDHTRPDDACTALAMAWPDAFQPLPKDLVCTMQYGGPQTASITGTIDGEQVRAHFDLTNGCQIARWHAVAPLLGAA